MTCKIEAAIEFDAVRITINGVTHLRFKRSKLLGMQSWVRQPTGQFFLELTFEGGVILADYDSREKWEAILQQLDSVL